MKLHVIDTGYFKLDGGAMFGVVPKTLWSRQHPPDEKNLCTWAMRCLLVEDGDRLILIDNGIGDKQDARFFGHYDLHGDATLDGSLRKAGFSRDDVTDVFLTHLHFDHCGGSIRWNSRRDGYEPAFRNARYWSNEHHWAWATKPNPREKASFLKENILPIEESGQLRFVELGRRSEEENYYLRDAFPGFDVFVVNGHTDAMMVPHIRYKGRTVAFMADLLPSVHHIPVPWVMAYDTRPLLTLQEKADFLDSAAEEDIVLFFEHDAHHECCTVERTEKGVRLKEAFPLSALG
ncbi:MAG: MBL fold metallo-hydrolase [Flavobacteriales bacterium]|jgi:glyoxylase-like metal-dependent hydrolase (beta-lactamase superfamily II)|nr:MAG: MBL fold metallo-hydrolase [Flavobacteriales bacterium]